MIAKLKQFYQDLQYAPIQLFAKIKETNQLSLKSYYRFVLVIRSILLVGFSIIFISLFEMLFSNDNASLSVLIFCLIMTLQVIGFNYNIKASQFSLFAYFACLLLGDIFVSHNTNPFGAFIVNAILITVIMVLLCNEPSLGTAGLFIFGYLFVVYFPASSMHTFKLRVIEMIVDYIICDIVLYRHHRDQFTEIKLRDIIKHFSLTDSKCLWQLVLGIGVSLALLCGQLLKLPRFFWLGTAALSILSIYIPDLEKYHVSLKKRVEQRAFGIITGCLSFGLLASILPSSIETLLSPLAGLLLGFTTSYHWNTFLNCFGALMLASTIYGIHTSVIFRIFNNFLGVTLAILFIIVIKYIWKHDQKIHA